ncbi:MAG: thioredoxin family protein [Bacillota bacterium]
MTDPVKIMVFGTTPACARCLQAEKEARSAAERFPPGRVVVEKHNALSETGRKYGINITPTVLIMGRKVAAGRVLSEAELVELIRKEMGD